MFFINIHRKIIDILFQTPLYSHWHTALKLFKGISIKQEKVSPIDLRSKQGWHHFLQNHELEIDIGSPISKLRNIDYKLH